MKTTATNKKLREVLTMVRDGTLVPQPEFQRRLVWSSRDKKEFIRTVLEGYPFPEIYTAAGDVDVDTGEGITLLVDGQQRISTLYDYFNGSTELKLGDLRDYRMLNEKEKRGFLEYDVVVRDLGALALDEIKIIFQKINATSYSLNAMEIRNARYDGALKRFAEQEAQSPFFDNNRIFSANEIKRMQDTLFLLYIIITILGGYFHRDDAVEEYLSRYNDEFPHQNDVAQKLKWIKSFIDQAEFEQNSRIWKKADLFTVFVELDMVVFQENNNLDVNVFRERLNNFFAQVARADPTFADLRNPDRDPDVSVATYAKAALQGTNDRGSRIARGKILRSVLRGEQLPYLNAAYKN